MGQFTAALQRFCRWQRYDLIHANFFMSGLVAADLKQALGIPFDTQFSGLTRGRERAREEIGVEIA